MLFKQNQHQKFAYEIIPLVFHNETIDFFAFLRRDETKFLKFWWDRAGVNLDETLRRSSDGINYEIRTLPDSREVILLTMPSPKKEMEAYYLALVERPKKRSFFSWRNLARVFVMSRSIEENAKPTTILGELTKSARYVEIKKGSQPSLNLFYKSVCELLDNNKKKSQ